LGTDVPALPAVFVTLVVRSASSLVCAIDLGSRTLRQLCLLYLSREIFVLVWWDNMFDQEERRLEPFVVASIDPVRGGEDSQIEARRLTTPPAASEMGC